MSEKIFFFHRERVFLYYIVVYMKWGKNSVSRGWIRSFITLGLFSFWKHSVIALKRKSFNIIGKNIFCFKNSKWKTRNWWEKPINKQKVIPQNIYSIKLLGNRIKTIKYQKHPSSQISNNTTNIPFPVFPSSHSSYSKRIYTKYICKHCKHIKFVDTSNQILVQNFWFPNRILEICNERWKKSRPRIVQIL